MSKSYNYIVAIILTLVLLSCKKESVNDSNANSIVETSSGTITTHLVLVPSYNSPLPALVTLKLIKNNNGTFDTVQTQQTDIYGKYTFKNIQLGIYQIIALPNKYFAQLSKSEIFEISKENINDTINFIHRPVYYLFPDTIAVGKDFNLLTDTTVFFSIWNLGTRDTLICQFDTTLVPEWCNVNIKTNIFPPKLYPTEINVIIKYTSEAYTKHLLPNLIKIPFANQYQQDTLYINIYPM